MRNLKRCPFCGSAAIASVQSHNSIRPDDWVIHCTNDSCPSWWVNYGVDSREEAVKLWNTRHES